MHGDALHLAVLKPGGVEGVGSCRPGVQPLAQVVGAEPDANDDVARDGDVHVKGRHAVLKRSTKSCESLLADVIAFLDCEHQQSCTVPCLNMAANM